MELLYTIFLLPIETIMKLVLELAYKFTNNYGVVIILLSIIINIALIPIYNMAEKWREKDKAIRDSMKFALDKIKQNYKGKERYFYTQALYKIHNYSPISSVKASAGFLIQIPFFFAAFSLLSNYEPIAGVGFGILSDLSKPDGLLFGLNLLPFVMTAINLLAAYVYINKFDKNEKYQLWGIALLFLVLLYTQASALLLYWTFNNIFSLIKNLIEKNLSKNVKKNIKNKLNLPFFKLNIENKTILHLTLFFINISLVFIIPLHIINNSDNAWNDFNLDIFFLIGLIYLILFVSLEYFLVYIVYKLKGKNYIVPISLFVLSWVVLSGFVFSIAESKGMVDPYSVSIDFMNLLLVSLISIIIFLFVLKKQNYKLPLVFNIIIISFALVSISNGMKNISNIKIDESKEIINGFVKLSDKNIIVLSFDGIPNFVFKNVLNDNEEFKEVFKDFTLFTEAFSTAPATSASTKSSLFGNRNFRKEGDRGENINLDNELNNLPMNKLQNSYTYEVYSHSKLNKEQQVPVNFATEELTNIHIIKNSIYTNQLSFSRVFTKYSNKILNKLKIFQSIEKLIVLLRPYNELDYIFEKYQNVSWKMPSALNKYDFEIIVKNLNVDSNKTNNISLREMHFSHTHFPVDFDENCNLQSTDKSWVDNNQNYQGLYNQTICATKQFSNFIQKLKQLRVYDKTLIILKSDHGEPATYFNDIPNGYKINNHSFWGYNRYKPLLMIKDFEKNQNEIKEDLFFVGLSDIAKTICIKSNLDNCNDFKGVNLFSENIKNEIIENPYIYIDVVIDEKSDFKSETHKTIKIDRSKYSNILEAFKNHTEVNLSID